MASKEGFFVADFDATRGHLKMLIQGVNDYSDKMTSFIADMEELNNLGKNIEEILPVLDATKKEIQNISGENLTAIKIFAGHIAETQETESYKINLD